MNTTRQTQQEEKKPLISKNMKNECELRLDMPMTLL